MVDVNSVILNKYESGHDSVAPHSDDEQIFGRTPTIYSVSLGASRRFVMISAADTIVY